MNEIGQKLIATAGLIGMIGMFAYMATTREGGRHVASTTPESYCAKQGSDGWTTIERRCLRRLNAGVCYDPEECEVFPEHRYVPDLDSSLDIRCASDSEDYLGTGDCEFVGTEAPEPPQSRMEYQLFDRRRGKTNVLRYLNGIVNLPTVKLKSVKRVDFDCPKDGAECAPGEPTSVLTDPGTVMRVARDLQRPERLLVFYEENGKTARSTITRDFSTWTYEVHIWTEVAPQ